MTTDPDWAEREYSPRLRVADATTIYTRWPRRAAATRKRHPPLPAFRYGPHEREVLDLFRAPDARGCVVFLHGGYWQAFSKDEFSWVADAFLARGLSVAVPSYPLCPEVRLGRIAEAAQRAFAYLWQEVLTPAERGGVVVTGHSAGGYLAALHLATDWTGYGLPADPLAGAVPVSGVFELAPLMQTSVNEGVRLDAAEAAALSLHEAPLRSRAPLALVVGSDESSEFHRQSDALAASWRALAPRVVDVPGRNHFDVIDGLAEPEAELHEIVVGMVEAAKKRR